MPMRHHPGKPRKRPRQTAPPATVPVRQGILCKAGGYLFQDPPPDQTLRQAQWEQVLALRAGELSPAVVAECARQRDVYIRHTLDELDSPVGREGRRHV